METADIANWLRSRARASFAVCLSVGDYNFDNHSGEISTDVFSALEEDCCIMYAIIVARTYRVAHVSPSLTSPLEREKVKISRRFRNLEINKIILFYLMHK